MRVLIIMLGLLLCLGCKSNDLTNTYEKIENQKGKSNSYSSQLNKYDPPVKLTTVGAVFPDVVFINGESLEHNVHTEWAKERLGIDIRYQWTITDVNNSYSNKLRLELARGELPDIVATRDVDLIQELISSGYFIEVDSLFEQYASEVWKDAMNENPNVWDFVSRGGRAYAIPILDYAYSSDPILWIREDWLERLNLTAPNTLDELEFVLEQFTNQDPDGNGINDTYGITVSLLNGVNTWMADSSWIFGAYGVLPKQWYAHDDGTLAYGSVASTMKEPLQLMKSWIEKGYISGESQWYDEVKAVQLFTSGQAGIVAGPYWMSGWPLSDVLKTDAGAKVVPIPVPAGPDGVTMRRGKLPVNGAVLINKNMEHPEVFFTYQNYLFENYALAKGEFKQGFAKGYDWNTVDPNSNKAIEQLSAHEVIGGDIRVEAYTITFDGARIPSHIVYEYPEDAIKTLLSQKDISRPDEFSGPMVTVMRNKWELLQKIEKKSLDQFLFGDKSIEQFEQFVDLWYTAGGLGVTQDVNTWLEEKKKHQARAAE